jgi:hypothetical protein
VPISKGGTNSTTASAARTSLGLVIGTDIPSPTGTGASGSWNINAATATTSGTVSDGAITAAKLASGVAVANLGFNPVQQGTGVGQLSNVVKIGYSAQNKIKATVDITDFGYFLTGPSVPESSLSGNGYEKLPSGLIMQWGSFTQSGSSTVVTLPIAFPNAFVNVQQTLIGSGNVSAPGVNIANGQQFVSTRDPVVPNNACYYFAIGF